MWEEKPVAMLMTTKCNKTLRFGLSIPLYIFLVNKENICPNLLLYGNKLRLSTGSVELVLLQDLFAAARYIGQPYCDDNGKNFFPHQNASIVSENFDIVCRKDPQPVINLALPPIKLLVCPGDNLNHLTLPELKITLHLPLEVVQCLGHG